MRRASGFKKKRTILAIDYGTAEQIGRNSGVDRCGPGGQKNYVTNFALTHGCTESASFAWALELAVEHGA